MKQRIQYRTTSYPRQDAHQVAGRLDDDIFTQRIQRDILRSNASSSISADGHPLATQYFFFSADHTLPLTSTRWSRIHSLFANVNNPGTFRPSLICR